ncbi:MAG: sugar transferase (PEP-CTERM/EpsH1 system associated) [Flavobacteriales bacterium]|jgi:sugar transferase (PEP-CTERM/EpsH1 system associated)
MKLFILVSRVPYPLEKGDKLRAYHLMKELAKEHEITLCCLTDKRIDEAAVVHLETFCHAVHVVKLNMLSQLFRLGLALFSSRPFQVHYFYQRAANRKINQIIEVGKFDHIYCQLIRCSEYVKDLHHIPKTLDYMDALSKGMDRLSKQAVWYLKPFAQVEAKRLTRYEHLIFDYFEQHTIISDQDRQLIVNSKRSSIQIILNGVDLNFFAPSSIEKTVEVVFTGNMSYAPNVNSAEFLANEIMPLVRKMIPNAKLLLAGASPNSKVKSLASEHVEVTGWMEDIREAYGKAKVFVAPMRIGTGLQNKLLEAMSMEVPSITSTLANNALKADSGTEILIGNSATEFANLICNLLENQEKRLQLGKNGRAFVKENYSWTAAGTDLNALIKLG